LARVAPGPIKVVASTESRHTKSTVLGLPILGMAEARQITGTALLPPPAVSIKVVTPGKATLTCRYAAVFLMVSILGFATAKLVSLKAFRSIGSGFGFDSRVQKQLTDSDAEQIVRKYTDLYSINSTLRPNHSLGTRDGTCQSPWQGASPLPRVVPKDRIPDILGGMAWKMLQSAFDDLLSAKPEAILSDLAMDFVSTVAREMNQENCGSRPAVAGQFCNFQTYDVPREYLDHAQAAHRDMLAQEAYVRTCDDPTGSKLVDGSSESDLCAVVVSMIYCAQAMPACKEDVWITNCLDTCILANHCANRRGGRKVPLQTCQSEICQFPPNDYQFWKIWKFKTGMQIFLFILVLLTCTGGLICLLCLCCNS